MIRYYGLEVSFLLFQSLWLCPVIWLPSVSIGFMFNLGIKVDMCVCKLEFTSKTFPFLSLICYNSLLEIRDHISIKENPNKLSTLILKETTINQCSEDCSLHVLWCLTVWSCNFWDWVQICTLNVKLIVPGLFSYLRNVSVKARLDEYRHFNQLCSVCFII